MKKSSSEVEAIRTDIFLGGQWEFWEAVGANNGTRHCSLGSLHRMTGAALPEGIG